MHSVSSLHNRDLLLSVWRRDLENVDDFSERLPRVLCYSNAPVTQFMAHHDTQTNIQQRLLENCEQYALNYLPTHLLRTSDMTLVSRTELWRAEKPRIEHDLREQDPQLVTNPALRNDTRSGGRARANNSSWDNWRLRTRGEIEIRRDAYIRSLFKFAIFSHRWGDDEPAFHDLLERRVSAESPTTGYTKLLNFCERARLDFACHYVWSDTCCINKESSVELDEAVRSMYRWYSIATVCIVYLANSSTIDDFRTESWFTRGWTLQELLAPQLLKFYGKNWKPIWWQMNEKGDKAIKEIRSAIEKVTGIPHDDLRRFAPSCDRIAEKMTWASQRKTTKIEDTAYCLLGLFNVSLSIAYGEADRAWYRMMGVIANECTDTSFFAWAGQPSPYSRALPSSPSSYSRFDPTCGGLSPSRHPSYQITKLGVVIKMLVMPACCTVLEDENGREFGYKVAPYKLESFLVGADVLHGHVDEYKVGIINFRSTGNVAVEVGDKCHCVVLARERSNDQGWVLVNTECVVVVLCLEEIYDSPETVLLYHTNADYDRALRRRGHPYNPVLDIVD